MILLKKPTLYRTGFFNSVKNDKIRNKQGLAPQVLASDCFMPPSADPSIKYECAPCSLYPITMPSPSEGTLIIPNDCSCVKYVQSI